MTVTFTEAANRDLVEISSYLLQYGQYALSFSQDMDAAIAHLERWPDSGAQRNDLSKNAKTRF